jgi:hypothetical protein
LSVVVEISLYSLSSSLSPCSSFCSLLTILDHGGHGGVTVGDFDEPRPTAAG